MAQKNESVTKELKISRAQRDTTIEVAIAAIILGAAIVFAIFLIKYISFNTRVIDAKDEAISNYEQTIINVGICVDSNGDGKLSGSELENCNPNDISVAEVPDSLRYNVMVNMSQNENLESVARTGVQACYNENGEKIDFSSLYDAATTEEEQMKYLKMINQCSALRVIPDALPAQKNTEAAMASLNQLFLIAGIEPESLGINETDEETVASSESGLMAIPVTWSTDTTIYNTQRALNVIEKSIRTYDVKSATLEWSSSETVSMSVKAQTYYVAGSETIEKTATVSGSQDKVQISGGS